MDELRQRILDLVKEYCEKSVPQKPFEEGDFIRYAGKCYDCHEMVNLVDSALDFWLTGGRFNQQFESKLAAFLGVKHCLMVNSGSSANLLAFMALTSPQLGERRIKRGDEIITVAATFPTTIAPAVQYGAVPVFVDVAVPQFNIDTSKLEGALSPKTKAVILAHTLGNPFNLRKVRDFCREHDLFLIEDNCDALGAEYFIDGQWKHTGTVGDICTSSFYPSHHITPGEGGAVYTNDPKLKKIMQSLRDWGRDCVCPPGMDNCCNARFDGQHGRLPKGYDHKYVYSHLGYNLKATDMQAAIGCAQLDKLPSFIEKRRENYSYLYENLVGLKEHLVIMEAEENSRPSWFGFLMMLKKRGVRDRLVKYLEENKIHTRMLFSGNITRHPCFDHLKEGADFRVVGGLENTDYLTENALWIGVYPGMTRQMLEYMAKKILNFFK